MKFKTEDEYVKWLETIPVEEHAPFCPFGGWHCNAAYSMSCLECEENRIQSQAK